MIAGKWGRRPQAGALIFSLVSLLVFYGVLFIRKRLCNG